MKLYLHHYAELLCFLVSLFCYRRFRGSAFVWFVPFMLLTLIAELVATYIAHVNGLPNYSIYNFLTTVAFGFYIWFICQYIENRIVKKSFLPVVILLGLAIVINIFFVNKGIFHRKTYIAGSIIIVFYCFFYLFELIKKYDIDLRIEKQPVFWVAIGLLFFFLSGAGFFIFINSFSRELKEQFNNIVRWLSVFMYGSFSIAFILCPRRKTIY